MALRKLVRSNYGGLSPVSIKHENLHSLKEEVILLCQSILETRISHLHGLALFTIPLRILTGKIHPQINLKRLRKACIWAIGILNQLLIRGCYTQVKFSPKNEVVSGKIRSV